MSEILHRIGIKNASVKDVYTALATRDGLAGWWTRDTQGNSAIDETIRFRFHRPDGSELGGFDMRVRELDPNRLVRWQVVDGPEEWIGTTIRWELTQDGDYTTVQFKHLDWREPVDFMHHCSTKWAIFLMSLKAFVETGKGAPSPGDVKIDNWN